MAAPMGTFFWVCYGRCFAAFSIIFYILFSISYVACTVSSIAPKDIIRLVNTHCVVVLFSEENDLYDDVYLQLSSAFRPEQRVAMRWIHSTADEFHWSLNEPLQWVSKPNEPSTIAVFKQKVIDRTCLLSADIEGLERAKPQAEAYEPNFRPINNTAEPLNAQSMLDFINLKCGTYRNIHGALSFQGLHREQIMTSLFHVGSISNFTVASWYNYEESKVNTIEDNSVTIETEDNSCPQKYSNSTKAKYADARSNRHKMPQCERITVPSWKTFFNEYVKLSRPVVIKGALRNWPAFKKWSTEYLRKLYGQTKVHIKLAPDGIFEGVDKSSHWEDYKTLTIPKKVKDKLPFSDLVVVRPATMNVNFSEFLDMTTGNSSFIKKQSPERVSAYLEYSSITQHFPKLEEDIKPFPFVNNNLKRRHLNIWLSDGDTLGKLHFDPFDNLLCQVSSKRVICFDKSTHF